MPVGGLPGIHIQFFTAALQVQADQQAACETANAILGINMA
jgi:hypothetical protein